MLKREQQDRSYMKLDFTIAQTPKTQGFSFEVLEPYDSSSYCLDSTKSTIPLYYILQTTDSKPLTSANLEYKILLDRFTKTAEKTDNPLENGHHKVEIDTGDILTAITGEGDQKAMFSFRFVGKTNDNNEIKKEGSANFNLRVPEKDKTCSSYSFYDYEKEKPKDNEGGASTAPTMTGD